MHISPKKGDRNIWPVPGNSSGSRWLLWSLRMALLRMVALLRLKVSV